MPRFTRYVQNLNVVLFVIYKAYIVQIITVQKMCAPAVSTTFIILECTYRLSVRVLRKYKLDANE